MFKKIFTFLFIIPKHKFYSDWTVMEKAYWGLWKRPADCFSVHDAINLNKDLIAQIQKEAK